MSIFSYMSILRIFISYVFIYDNCNSINVEREVNRIIFDDFHPKLDIVSQNELTNKIKTIKCSKVSIKLSELHV